MDIDADVGVEVGFDVDGDGVKPTDRGGGGDVSGAAEEFEEEGFFGGGSLGENVHAGGRVFFADPGGFFEGRGVEFGEFVGGSFALAICAVVAVHAVFAFCLVCRR